MEKNVFTEEINNAIEVLENGGLILYPTDTVWGIGCDATNKLAVAKVFRLKKNQDQTSFICLVANDAMLENHVAEVPELAYNIMDLSTKPTTIVYDKPRGVAQNLITKDNTLGLRVASDKFCKYLIGRFKKPIVSTSANTSGAPIPKSFDNIDKAILSGVDYVVNLQKEKQNGVPSAIIRLANDGNVKIIRE